LTFSCLCSTGACQLSSHVKYSFEHIVDACLRA
jgi:hypothetical protein